MITIRNFSFSYPDGNNALRQIGLTFREGETTAIVGPNGAGKSTLLLCINGILRGRGTILVAGLEVNDKNIYQIRKTAGIVFQNPDDQLFNPTVYEDIAFGPKQMDVNEQEIAGRVKSSLAAVGMSGYETRESHHLSFGEKKKISLATVLAMSPQVLLLDEPTSNLDPKGRRGFIELLKNTTITKIIATHDLDMALELCSKVVILDKGEIKAEGSPDTILANEPLLNAHNLELPLQLTQRPIYEIPENPISAPDTISFR